MKSTMWGIALMVMVAAAAAPMLANASSKGRYYAGPPKRAILYPDWYGEDSVRDGWAPYLRQRSIERAGSTVYPGGRVFELKWRKVR